MRTTNITSENRKGGTAMNTVTIATRRKRSHRGRNFLIILATLLLVMASAGIAGQAVAGDVENVPVAPQAGSAEINVKTKQALSVVGGSVTGANGYIFVNDDNTAFKAPAEVYTGDRFNINLAIGNSSQNPLDCQITVSSTEGFTLDVRGSNGASNVVRLGTDTWAFRLDANESDDVPDLTITVAVSTATPGNYNLGCVIEALTFPGGE